MKTEKKQLLLISTQPELITELKNGLSIHFNIHTVGSMHSGFNVAMNLLPDLILLDQTSLNISSFKNLANFKSTHFLNKCWLMMYSRESSRYEVEKKYRKILDEVYFDSVSPPDLCKKIIQQVHAEFSLSNYWKDAFMGLFHLLGNPVVLLQQENIIAMNDAFKRTFKINNQDGLKLIDYVNCENKMKIRTSLRNFARGKHMHADTTTAFKINGDKVRNAKITLCKLDKMTGQFIMMINFSEDKILVKEKIGSQSERIENCFEENSHMTDFSFTKREKEIIKLLCKGYKTKEISQALFISPKTIEKHRANIIKRTQSETILESIIYALNHNLIDLRYP